MTKNLVLLHGWGGSKKSLEPLSNELKQLGFNTFVLELPGHGETKEMNEPWNMDNFTDWLNKELNSLSLTAYSLVGHSFGGKTIISALQKKLVHPEKIVLINISGIKPKNTLKTNVWKTLSQFLKIFKFLPFYEFFRRFIYKHVIGATDYIDAKNNLKETFKNINNEHFDDYVSQINIPTLLIWGSKDNQTPLWMGKFLHEQIKQSKLEVIDETHGLPLKRPVEIAKIIVEFLK